MRAVWLGVLCGTTMVVAQSNSIEQKALEIFKELVEINTSSSGGDTTTAAAAVAARLQKAGFDTSDVQVLGPSPRHGNLVARLRGSGRRRPILLLAHLDVVDARREDWSFDPFTLVEKDGFFYGRGTADDKAMASQFVANVIRLKEEGFRPDRDLILALTDGEETGDFNGVEWLLKNHRDLIDAEFAINEGGGGVVRNGRYLANEVQVAEKTYQDFRLEIRNHGGHSALPVKDNAITRLGAALTRLGSVEFPIRIGEITRTYLARFASIQTDASLAADMRAVSRPTPDRPAAARLAASSPYFNALMRTTCVATMVEGGHANNALPQVARAIVNCRILPDESPGSVRERLVDALADSAIEVTSVGPATETSPPTRLLPGLMDAVESLTKEMFPGVVVVPVMSTGATDGVFLRNNGIPTYGIDATFGDIDDVRAHGRDERVGVKQYFEGLEFQYRLIKALSSGGTRAASR